MANEYFVNSDDLTVVADSIRAKGGTTEQLVFPGGFVTAIAGMETGKTGATLTVTTPAEGVTVTVTKGELSYTKTTGADGTAVFSGLESGTWTITASDETHTSTATVDIDADYEKTMSFIHIYGISRDITASSPEWVREDEAVGKTATASVGTIAGSSDFDTCYPWSEIQRETLSTGDVMVRIPKFWFKRYIDGSIEHIKISDKETEGFVLHPAFNHAGIVNDYLYVGAYKTSSNKSISGGAPDNTKTRATFRTNAKSKGSGWGLIDIAAMSAIQMLILIEFATNNVQVSIGRGYCDGNSGHLANGSCDEVPNLTGIPIGTDGKTGVVWRGIENFWGNLWEWIDGVNCNDSYYYVCNNPSQYADDTTTNYTKLSFTRATDWSHAYITREGIDTGSNSHVMLPSAAGSGSDSTYQCDTCWSAAGYKLLRRGGALTDESMCGLFTNAMHDGSTTNALNIGSRLQYIPS